MNWIFDFVFGRRTGTVRVNKDHLPGLTAPKPAPFTPKRAETEMLAGADLDSMYERFKQSETSKPKKLSKANRGVWF
jgi:hypothetical protein